MFVGIAPGIGQEDLACFRPHICKSIEDVRELVARQVLRLMVSPINGPRGNISTCCFLKMELCFDGPVDEVSHCFESIFAIHNALREDANGFVVQQLRRNRLDR